MTSCCLVTGTGHRSRLMIELLIIIVTVQLDAAAAAGGKLGDKRRFCCCSAFARREIGNATVAANKRLKLDLAGGSSMSNLPEDDASLRLTLSPPGQHSLREDGSPHQPVPAYSQQQQQHQHQHPDHLYGHGAAGPAAGAGGPAAAAASSASADSDLERSRSQSQSQSQTQTRRSRQTSVDRPSGKLKEEQIPPPYAWATDRRAVVHPLDRITRSGITSIQGEVICKRCDGSQTVDINLQASFLQLDNYFVSNKDLMHDRAPKIWMVPRLLDCTMCHQSDCVKPVINQRKRHINWLFLMLTQTLGLCTLDQLKYFCKHTHKHRTGAKDRVLYLTYVGLLKQLNPGGHYD